MTGRDRPRRGRFIVLEGGEGSGKTTQATLLSGWMEASGVSHIVAREPGGTVLGEAIRSVLLDRPELEMPAESELFLMLAARAAFVHDVVRPALNEGTVVLADRFSLSTLAYQGYGRGLDLDGVRRCLEFATGGLEPDLYVLLELDPEEGARRQRHGGKDHDRIERAGPDFLRRVHEGYMALAEGKSGAGLAELGIRVVDARGAAEDVHVRIRDILIATFPETFGPAEG